VFLSDVTVEARAWSVPAFVGAMRRMGAAAIAVLAVAGHGGIAIAQGDTQTEINSLQNEMRELGCDSPDSDTTEDECKDLQRDLADLTGDTSYEDQEEEAQRQQQQAAVMGAIGAMNQYDAINNAWSAEIQAKAAQERAQAQARAAAAQPPPPSYPPPAYQPYAPATAYGVPRQPAPTPPPTDQGSVGVAVNAYGPSSGGASGSSSSSYGHKAWRVANGCTSSSSADDQLVVTNGCGVEISVAECPEGPGPSHCHVGAEDWSVYSSDIPPGGSHSFPTEPGYTSHWMACKGSGGDVRTVIVSVDHGACLAAQ
jgi:hypothetical protein